jgi:ADP-dependent NAD(P)H-hydrate dehydratase / NAD(P)H-hydrate epimerase
VKLVNVAEMQAIEREADLSGLSYAEMMENAGLGVAGQVHAAYGQVANRALALVGSGNNGGDALVALATLASWGWQVSACLVRPRPEADPLVERVRQAAGEVFELAKPEDAALAQALANTDVLLDGILGTGVRLPLKPPLSEVLAFVRQQLAALEHLPAVVAVDSPSGVDCDTGACAAEALHASLTVTMAAVKQGLLKLPAFERLGELKVVEIGRLDGLAAWEKVQRFVVDAAWVRSVLPERKLDAHKGTFGTALVAAGSLNYTGAAWLAGQAAYRIGAGLVTLAVIEPLHAALAGQFPEATWLLLPAEDGVVAAEAASVLRENLGRATALLVGPGFGLEKTTQEFLHRLLMDTTTQPMGFLSRTETISPQDELPPLVVDADGLKLLSRLPGWAARLPPGTVLTPHPGEMSVLTELSKEEILAGWVEIAEKYAREWGHVVVLKGAFSVIAASDGRTAVIPVATPALARAGTGDVLAGLIVGLRAQGLAGFEAAAAGAWIHAQAGLLAARQLGSSASVLAGDVLGAVPGVLAEL